MRNRTLITFDLETTGVNTETDQICQYFFTKNVNKTTRQDLTNLVKPTIKIPKEASDVTGITNETVKDAKPFREYAQEIMDYIFTDDGVIICGYNSIGYDVPLLVNELTRNGIKDSHKIFELPMIDGFPLYKSFRKRDLTSAVKDLCGYDLEDAHDAGADVGGTKDLLHEFYKNPTYLGPHEGLDHNQTLDLMISMSRDENAVDFAGKLIKNDDGVIVYNIGKDKGESVLKNPGFARWMLKKDFPQQTKYVIRQLLKEISW